MIAKKTVISTSLVISAIASAMTSVALANTSNGTDFQPVYQRVAGWATGLPVIILVVALSLAGFINAARSGNIIMGLVYSILTAFIYTLLSLVIYIGGTTF